TMVTLAVPEFCGRRPNVKRRPFARASTNLTKQNPRPCGRGLLSDQAMIVRSRPEAALPADGSRPVALVFDGVEAGREARIISGWSGGKFSRASKRGVHLRIGHFDADIEVLHRVPHGARSHAPESVIRVAVGDRACSEPD